MQIWKWTQTGKDNNTLGNMNKTLINMPCSSKMKRNIFFTLTLKFWDQRSREKDLREKIHLKNIKAYCSILLWAKLVVFQIPMLKSKSLISQDIFRDGAVKEVIRWNDVIGMGPYATTSTLYKEKVRTKEQRDEGGKVSEGDPPHVRREAWEVTQPPIWPAICPGIITKCISFV